MPERVLTQRDLNRATLARQLLLERKRLSPTAVIERLVGMQAQWPPAPYVGIWTRTTGFRREALERALLRGDVVRPTAMRGTLHFVTRRDYPLFWAAFRDRHWGYGSASLARALPLVAEARARAPLTQRDAFTWIGEPNPKHVFRAIKRRGHLLHAPETALWEPKASLLFHAVDEPAEVEPREALGELVRRYLAAFGPATKADVHAWSHVPIGWFAHALEGLPTHRDDAGRMLYDVPDAPLPPGETPVPVRFLPKWDNLLLGYDGRRRVLPERYRKRVIGMNGDVAQTFLVDGLVAGTWRVEEGRVVADPFEPLPRAAAREVADEAARLEEWLRT